MAKSVYKKYQEKKEFEIVKDSEFHKKGEKVELIFDVAVIFKQKGLIAEDVSFEAEK